MMYRRGRRGRYRTIECPICTETLRETAALTLRCCAKRMCKECMCGYCGEQVNEGIFTISCPFTDCDKKLDHGVVVSNLTDTRLKSIFEKMITESMSDPHVKTCPSCSKLERVSETTLTAINKAKNSWFASISSKTTYIKCGECNHEWCFSCHAPWHKGMTCSTFLKGDRAFGQWMSWRSGGTVNAHFCPKCKIPIQRSSGCPSMVCSKCNVNWCYDCGNSKTWDNTILGPHYSKFAFKGCLAPNYLFYRSIPLTYFVRTATLALILTGTISLALVVLIIGVPILPLVLLGCCTTLPLYAGVLRRENPIAGLTPYNILNKSITNTTRFFIACFILSLIITMGPVVILAGTTLVPLLAYYPKVIKQFK